MTTITLEGVDWSCESPSEFKHDECTVYFEHSVHTDRRWWGINALGEDVDYAFVSRREAVRYAKHFIIGQQRSAFDA